MKLAEEISFFLSNLWDQNLRRPDEFSLFSVPCPDNCDNGDGSLRERPGLSGTGCDGSRKHGGRSSQSDRCDKTAPAQFQIVLLLMSI
ncbi:hypothetical protein predicted by Glimmer/Critica (plasmid) [Sinorhizobium fredii HH103]|uniref:Uncharacterized protein n=1 Tax=Sinorhizobium fredii (strain HH103) TaxID=1117943 RepID=A0A0B7MLG1_SINF1|nr:hypothetical protein predicted by Glimmer/Critica [Sinorhizobium fredii HH103]